MSDPHDHTLTPEEIESEIALTYKSDRLVGRYLRYFAYAEIDLDDAVGAALGLSVAQTWIVTVNVPFDRKIDILLAALEFSRLNASSQTRYRKHLNALRGFNQTDRILVAHFAWRHDGDSATKFYHIRARGKLEAVPKIWTDLDFENKVKALDTVSDELKSLAAVLKADAPSEAILKMAKILSEAPLPGGSR